MQYMTHQTPAEWVVIGFIHGARTYVRLSVRKTKIAMLNLFCGVVYSFSSIKSKLGSGQAVSFIDISVTSWLQIL